MSVEEQYQKDKKRQLALLKKEYVSREDQFRDLKARMKRLKENPDLKWFMQNYVVKPAGLAYKRLTASDSTNPTFIAKGEVNAYNKVASWEADLNSELNNLTELMKKMSKEIHEENPATRPEL